MIDLFHHASHFLHAEAFLILSAISTALTAGGAVMQGEAEGAALNTQADYLDSAARQSEIEGAANESAQRIANRRLLGEQIAATGASGVTLSGSPLDFILDRAVDAEMEALNVRYQGARQAHGLRTEAGQSRVASKNARKMGALGGAAALIAGGVDVYGKLRPPGGSSATGAWGRIKSIGRSVPGWGG